MGGGDADGGVSEQGERGVVVVARAAEARGTLIDWLDGWLSRCCDTDDVLHCWLTAPWETECIVHTYASVSRRLPRGRLTRQRGNRQLILESEVTLCVLSLHGILRRP